MTDHLLRRYAPIPDAGWQQIDDEAKNRLTPRLAARRLCGLVRAARLGAFGHQPGPDRTAGGRTAGDVLDDARPAAIGSSR
ncbi:MAG: encapsulin [Pseudonocardiaceae bacterium]